MNIYSLPALNRQLFDTCFRLITALTLLISPAVFASGLPGIHDIRTEAADAKKRQVPILVLFMSDSCHYCEIVLEDFLLPMEKDPEFRDKVILRQIETSSNDKLIDFDGSITTQNGFASKRKVWGVPQVFLFDSHGNVLTSIVGLLTQDFYYAYLDNAITESLEKIRNTSN